MTDALGNVVRGNAAAEELVDGTLQERVARSILDGLHPDRVEPAIDASTGMPDPGPGEHGQSLRMPTSGGRSRAIGQEV